MKKINAITAAVGLGLAAVGLLLIGQNSKKLNILSKKVRSKVQDQRNKKREEEYDRDGVYFI